MQLKPCEYCKTIMPLKIYSGNRIEPESMYRKRATCGRSCSISLRAKKVRDGTPVTTQYCEAPGCGKEIPRKLTKHGHLEAKSLYEERKTCCKACNSENKSYKRRQYNAMLKSSVPFNPINKYDPVDRYIYGIRL